MQHVGDVLGIVEDPVLEFHKPWLAALRTQCFPFGLVDTQFPSRGGHGFGGLVGYFADDGAVGRVAYFDAYHLRFGMQIGHGNKRAQSGGR